MAEVLLDKFGIPYPNMKQAAMMMGCSLTVARRRVIEAGVMVKGSGRDKQMSICDVAAIMSTGRISPLD
jgi:hypothetical protein